MTYNKWYVSGDTHRDFSRFENVKDEEDIAVIILGDAAVNWTLNQYDQQFKQSLKKNYPNITWYLLRGNHEARPTDVPTMLEDWDDEVQGYVYYESDFLNIRYFKDGGEYNINGYSILTIGGAYSVDKWYRLSRGAIWHADEQLTIDEMVQIKQDVKGKAYDFVFTHTCPFDWRPTDLFLSGLDQSTVDNTMEFWLNEIKDTFSWKVWLFGHYHADRLERPYVEIFFKNIESLDDIWERWDKYEKDLSLDWWLRKSPQFYWGE